MLCGLLLDLKEEATLILPDFTGGQVEELLQFLYGKLPVVKKPGEIYSCLGGQEGAAGGGRGGHLYLLGWGTGRQKSAEGEEEGVEGQKEGGGPSVPRSSSV